MRRRNIPTWAKILKRRILLRSASEVRAVQLREAIHRFSKELTSLGIKDSLMFRDKRPFIYVSGIWLSTLDTDRYFPSSKNESSVNDAVRCVKLLQQFKIQPKVIFDIGANFGEHSLYFAKSYPLAKVYAIEPSPRNLEILHWNLQVNEFAKNVLVLAIAVSDQDGTVYITNNLGSENKLVQKPSSTNSTKVPTNTLSSIISKTEVETLDFVKIDIEGSEFLLLSGILQNQHRIKSLLIEFGAKGVLTEEIEFLRKLSQYYDFFYDDGLPVELNIVSDVIKNGSIDLFMLHRNFVKSP